MSQSTSDLYLLYEDGKTEASYHELTREEAESLVPHGDYCYTWEGVPSVENNFRGKIKKCPFWDSFYPKMPDQSYGFCHLMKIGDFTKDGTHLLWDQVKCCGVNLPDESEYTFEDEKPTN